ncbi:hypothetical protein OIU85_000956 [Salix viminalis]|uniref:Gamma interferon inducible lysosomal thiol reductase GILT n=1 Tax=Salix viminalis TaxID=40686 RepID=A0A9Q0VKQ3_SALVM|nr:hypothetical protein OIU85_000956 [Salix viminalis]
MLSSSLMAALFASMDTNECFLNAIEACTITIYPDVVRHFRFIHCVEKMSLENKMNEWVNCFGMSGLGKAPVDCYTRGYGESGNLNLNDDEMQLEKKYAAETAKLNPPHRFVPWVVVNNQPLREDFENFVSYVCKAYRGTKMPEACKSLPRENNLLRKENHINSVCFVDQTSNLTSSAPVIANVALRAYFVLP